MNASTLQASRNVQWCWCIFNSVVWLFTAELNWFRACNIHCMQILADRHWFVFIFCELLFPLPRKFQEKELILYFITQHHHFVILFVLCVEVIYFPDTLSWWNHCYIFALSKNKFVSVLLKRYEELMYRKAEEILSIVEVRN